MFRVLAILAIVFSSLSIWSQDSDLDSLESLYKTAPNDSIRVQASNDLGSYLYKKDQFTALSYWTETYKLALKKIETSTDSTLFFYQTVLASSYNGLGIINRRQGKSAEALEFYHKALKINKELNDSVAMGSTLYNLGNLYKNIGQYDDAEKYTNQSLSIRLQLGHVKGIINCYNNLGVLAKKAGDSNKAIEYYESSLVLAEENNLNEGMAIALGNIGVVYQRVNQDYNSALSYFQKSLAIQIELNNQQGIASGNYNISGLYLDLNQPEKSVTHINKAISIYSELRSHSKLAKCYSRLSKAQKQLGNYPGALESYKMFSKEKDTMLLDRNEKKLAKLEAKFIYDKKRAADSIQQLETEKLTKAELAAKDAQLNEAEITEQRDAIIMIGLFGGLAFVIIFIIFIYNRLKLTRKQKLIIEEQKTIVEEKNQEVEDSINYAKRIQEAILPKQSLADRLLPENFILYKPKDIVAGDFYWLQQVGTNVIFAAADCTGHGVPGAMVSVVCNNAMNRSVREFKLTVPGEILDKTRELVIEQFAEGNEDVKDGMDIALCSLEGNTLKYAGANNALWIIRKGSGAVEEYKATKQPIGKVDDPIDFTTHEIKLNKGDSFYIFSDGYVDQFGGEKGKKFKSKAFKELLLSIQAKALSDQQIKIDETFENWRGDLEQVDDVCVIGIRI